MCARNLAREEDHARFTLKGEILIRVSLVIVVLFFLHFEETVSLAFSIWQQVHVIAAGVLRAVRTTVATSLARDTWSTRNAVGGN